jgi:hypothetical protein
MEKPRKTGLTIISLAVASLAYLFLPIPWIMALDVNQEILKENLLLPNTLIFAVVFISIFIVLLSYLYANFYLFHKNKISEIWFSGSILSFLSGNFFGVLILRGTSPLFFIGMSLADFAWWMVYNIVPIVLVSGLGFLIGISFSALSKSSKRNS